MRITIFGATGLLGKALMQGWAQDQSKDEVIGLGSKDADIRDATRVAEVVARNRPEWIILAAAYTDVDGCESNLQLAFDVNRHGAANVARAAKQNGSRFLLVSTDYVFDGKKASPYETDDPRAPRGAYGRSKAEAEIAVTRILPETCIVRTSWLFGAGGRCFPETILRLAASRPTIDVVNDQRGSPTYAPDLAQAIKQLCHKNAAGIVHATNRGECTWFEFACEIVVRAGLPTVVCPTTSAKFVRPAERPQYSVLSLRSLEPYSIAAPSWQNALARYMDERQITNRTAEASK
jgi:dTDP-4-dehydrorhamnose reductase